MRRAALALALALASHPALACQCLPWSREEIMRRADIVFEGTVAVIAFTPRHVQATIDVSRVERGPPVRTITLLTPDSNAACGVTFRLAERVVMAARRDGAHWRTDLCMSFGLAPGTSPQR